jgi:8-amino-7-oxononanoate synthase
MVGESREAIVVAKELQRKGFYLLPVRPPTVPDGTSRIRISLTAGVSCDEVAGLVASLPAKSEE